MHRNSLLMFEKYASSHICPGDRVLEIGPNPVPSPYRLGTQAEVAAWQTLDFPGPNELTYELTDGYRFPVTSDSYDVVLSGQVLEHIPKPWRWMPEVARVTRPGGIVVTIAPVSWPFHEAPYDCWRVYPDGLRGLYEDAGLEVLVAEWGSLELEPVVQKLPRKLRRWGLWQQLSTPMLWLHDHMHFPLEGAFDTIVIGRKS
jgi:SAM-dependent methyltransferase